MKLTGLLIVGITGKGRLCFIIFNKIQARKLRSEELAYDYENDLWDFPNYSELESTIGRGGLPERFYNLFKMLNHYTILTLLT